MRPVGIGSAAAHTSSWRLELPVDYPEFAWVLGVADLRHCHHVPIDSVSAWANLTAAHTDSSPLKLPTDKALPVCCVLGNFDQILG